MSRHPERTCIGCRGVFAKNEVVRIVSGPAGPLIDYQEKLPGRAAYVCPRRACVELALVRDHLARALHRTVKTPQPEHFLLDLASAIRRRIASLVSMATKSHKAVSGFSAVDDAIQKKRVSMLFLSSDLSEGTRGKVLAAGRCVPDRQVMLFTKQELGALVGRHEAGVIGILDKGFSSAIWREYERLKGLIKEQP